MTQMWTQKYSFLSEKMYNEDMWGKILAPLPAAGDADGASDTVPKGKHDAHAISVNSISTKAESSATITSDLAHSDWEEDFAPSDTEGTDANSEEFETWKVPSAPQAEAKRVLPNPSDGSTEEFELWAVPSETPAEAKRFVPRTSDVSWMRYHHADSQELVLDADKPSFGRALTPSTGALTSFFTRPENCQHLPIRLGHRAKSTLLLKCLEREGLPVEEYHRQQCFPQILGSNAGV
eukprot:gnl/MRDRNA2_/MRDRNA2_27833_c0_seq1.p1 gnl/MRDRNA2_/MRDRNA2_27833_c0~~gnl/MRDRNA2_/MRDRNA2_27833_c0_seq1.p1  ORF type:complete len:236 (+),score=41.58 gnl/MRDRNA2_/MRDRNA2_27833_c0_seq1:109-816(+)